MGNFILKIQRGWLKVIASFPRFCERIILKILQKRENIICMIFVGIYTVYRTIADLLKTFFYDKRLLY